MFWKIQLPDILKNLAFYGNRQKNIMSLNKKFPKPHEGAELAHNWGQIWTRLKNPITTFSLTISMDLNFSQFFGSNV